MSARSLFSTPALRPSSTTSARSIFSRSLRTAGLAASSPHSRTSRRGANLNEVGDTQPRTQLRRYAAQPVSSSYSGSSTSGLSETQLEVREVRVRSTPVLSAEICRCLLTSAHPGHRLAPSCTDPYLPRRSKPSARNSRTSSGWKKIKRENILTSCIANCQKVVGWVSRCRPSWAVLDWAFKKRL